MFPWPGKNEWLALAGVPGARGPTFLSEVLSHELWLQARLHRWAWHGIGEDYKIMIGTRHKGIAADVDK